MKTKELDLFYTHENIARKCIAFAEKKLGASQRRHFLEPAAGTGSFSKQLKNCVSVDIEPKMEGAIKADFLKMTREDIFPKIKTENVCVIGNPPFGKNSSLAVKFFNHATNFGDAIAFIVPKTFRKDSLQRKLHRNFWLVGEMEIPKNSFTKGDVLHDTPSVFQVWERRDRRRALPKVSLDNRAIEFVKTPEEADFAVRRVGGRAGKAMLEVISCAPVSHYFLKVKSDEFKKESLVDIINTIDFSELANATAGVRSISKAEFIKELAKVVDISL